MTTLGLAARNLLRNKRRTVMTLLSMIVASTAIIVFGGFISFSFEGLRESTIRTQLGHFQIAKNGYFEQGSELSNDFLIDDPEHIEEQLYALPHIQSITRRLTGSGLIGTEGHTLSVKLIGVMPEREEEFAVFETIINGMQLDANMPDGCVIGSELAKGLRVAPDATVTILSTTLQGVINAVDCQVVGIVRTTSREYDKVYVKLPLPHLQRLLDTQKIERILLLADDTAYMPTIAKQLSNLAGTQYEIKTWFELAEFYRRVFNLYTSIFQITSAILGVVVFLSIANIMSMTVFERFQEIGTLRAIGQTRSKILYLFITEGVLIGIVGGVIGAGVGIAVSMLINIKGGISVPPPPGMSSGYTAYITINVRTVLYAFSTSLIAASLSSFYPAYRASKFDVIKALQYR